MKYTRLTKEQLEALHFDFARFLATQQITADEWELLKKEKKHIAEEEIDIFSDLVWEKSLQKVAFLERIDQNSIYCFHFQNDKAKMISVQISNPAVDLSSPEGFSWLKKNIQTNEIQLFTGKKTFSVERNMEIFNLIQQGMQISDGVLFHFLNQFCKEENN